MSEIGTKNSQKPKKKSNVMKIVGGKFLGIWLYLTRLSFLEILENAVPLTTWKFYNVENQTRIFSPMENAQEFPVFPLPCATSFKGTQTFAQLI